VAKNELIATVLDQKSKPIARIALNGYNIRPGGALGNSGAMRSFRVLQGATTLWDHWEGQQSFTLSDEEGNASEARIAAYPAEESGFGFIEFV
jgi:hypothetical protein